VSEEAAVQVFWLILIVLGFVVPLIVGAIYVEVLAPKSRAWIRRVRGIEAGKRAQAMCS
jgi:thiol:disulfide interchange protein